MIDILGGIAFLVIIAAPVIAVIALHGRPANFTKPTEIPREFVPLDTIEKRADESRTLRSHYLRDLLWPAG